MHQLKMTLIFSSNVLEHIKDDQTILNLMKKKLKREEFCIFFYQQKCCYGVKWMKQLVIIGVMNLKKLK